MKYFVQELAEKSANMEDGPGKQTCSKAHNSKRTYDVNFAVSSLSTLAKEAKDKPKISPGVLTECLKNFAENSGSKQVKVAFDGKKVNASLTACHGDIDLWGCEPSPTYNENIQRKEEELQTIEELIAKENKDLTSADLHSVVKILGVRVKDMR